MLIFLPHILEETYPYTHQKQREFSAQRVRYNLGLLQSRLGDSLDELSYVTALVLQYAEYFEQINAARWITDDPKHLGEHVVDLTGEQIPLGCYNTFAEGILVRKDKYVLLSDTHTSSSPVLRACKKASPQRRYGVLCVDAHADVYSTNEPLWKGNVFSTLIEDGAISRMLLVGVPQYRIDNITSQEPDAITAKIDFANWETKGEVSRKLEQLADVTDEIYVSVDIDGLNTRDAIYTAMEYCSFQVVLNLGTTRLDEHNEDGLRRALNEIVRPLGHIQLDGTQTRKNLYLIGEDGIPLPELLRVIEESKSYLRSINRELGVTCQGGRVIGDIVELFGIDLLGQTAQAICAIVKTLNQGQHRCG